MPGPLLLVYFMVLTDTDRDIRQPMSFLPSCNVWAALTLQGCSTASVLPSILLSCLGCAYTEGCSTASFRLVMFGLCLHQECSTAGVQLRFCYAQAVFLMFDSQMCFLPCIFQCLGSVSYARKFDRQCPSFDFPMFGSVSCTWMFDSWVYSFHLAKLFSVWTFLTLAMFGSQYTPFFKATELCFLPSCGVSVTIDVRCSSETVLTPAEHHTVSQHGKELSPQNV